VPDNEGNPSGEMQDPFAPFHHGSASSSSRAASIETVTALLDAVADAESGTDPALLIRQLDRAERLLDDLRASGQGNNSTLGNYTDSGEYRWLCLLSAEAAHLRDGITGDQLQLGRRIYWLEQATSPAGPMGEQQPEDLWWGRAQQIDTQCDLALAIATRWERSSTSREGADADRVIALLTGVLDGPDAHLVTTPTTSRAILGLVLSDRSRAPDYATPERLADRGRAIEHLRAAHEAEDLDPTLRPAVAFDLAILCLLDHSDRYDSIAPQKPPAADVERELDGLLDLLRPLLSQNDEAGAQAAELSADIADLLCEYAPQPVGQALAIDSYRAALAHDALDSEATLRVRWRMGLALVERAERNTASQCPSDPVPHVDRTEALTVFDSALALLGQGRVEDSELYASCLAAAVETRVQELSLGLLDEPGLNRLISHVLELAEIQPAVFDGAQSVLRASILVAHRALRLASRWAEAVGPFRSFGKPTSQFAARTAADLGVAIKLLRLGAASYNHEDDLYRAAIHHLGVALVMDFAVHVSSVRLDRLREGIDVLRAVLENLPRDDESVSDIAAALLLALTYEVFFTAYFFPKNAALDASAKHDTTRYTNVRKDLRLLGSLMGPETANQDPTFVLLSAMVDILQNSGASLTPEVCRIWQGRFQHAATRLGPGDFAVRAVMLAMSAAFGFHLIHRADATPEESAAARQALLEARTLVGSNAGIQQSIGGLLLHMEHGDADLLAQLRGLFGASPVSTTSAVKGTPEPTAQPDRPVEYVLRLSSRKAVSARVKEQKLPVGRPQSVPLRPISTHAAPGHRMRLLERGHPALLAARANLTDRPAPNWRSTDRHRVSYADPICQVHLVLLDEGLVSVNTTVRIAFSLTAEPGHPWAVPEASQRQTLEVVATPLGAADIEPTRGLYRHIRPLEFAFRPNRAGRHVMRFTIYAYPAGTALQQVETEVTVIDPELGDCSPVPAPNRCGPR